MDRELRSGRQKEKKNFQSQFFGRSSRIAPPVVNVTLVECV